MQLEEAIFSASSASERSVLCAREPFSPDAEARIVEFTAEWAVPEDVKQEGFSYFLGREEVVALLAERVAKSLPKSRQVALLIYYATNDAYPSWYNELAGAR